MATHDSIGYIGYIGSSESRASLAGRQWAIEGDQTEVGVIIYSGRSKPNLVMTEPWGNGPRAPPCLAFVCRKSRRSG
jgi:hypothetical protein